MNTPISLGEMACLYIARSPCSPGLPRAWRADRSPRGLLPRWGRHEHIKLGDLIPVNTLYPHISSYYITSTGYGHNNCKHLKLLSLSLASALLKTFLKIHYKAWWTMIRMLTHKTIMIIYLLQLIWILLFKHRFCR